MNLGRILTRKGTPKVVKELRLPSGEKVLAWTPVGDADGGDRYAVATTWHLGVAQEGVVDEDGTGLVGAVPWHLIDTASWDRDTERLVVRYVEAGRPDAVWTVSEARTFLQVLRERTQASVVLSADADAGGRRRARVAIRRDLRTGELSEQAIPAQGADLREPWLAEQVEISLAQLRDGIGRAPYVPIEEHASGGTPAKAAAEQEAGRRRNRAGDSPLLGSRDD